MRTAIIACVKCEERYIREWIGHHLNLGFDHLFLADNNDMDYKPTLESVIMDYVDQGRVTIVDCKGMNPVQPKCYNMIMDLYGNDYDWYAMIDTDEFFCLPKHGNIKTFLESIPQDTDIVYLHWRLYGDNGLLTYDGRPVQERFTTPETIDGRDDGYSKYVKSLFRNKAFIEGRTGERMVIDSQHSVFRDKEVVVRNPLGEKISFHHGGHTFGYDEKEFGIAYLRHYMTKSLEEYMEVKRLRGAASRLKSSVSKYNVNHYFVHNEKTQEKLDFLRTRYGIEV